MASLRRAKKEAKKRGETFIDPTKEKKKLVREVNQLIRETNKRIRQLNNKGLSNTFSSKRLFDRLGSKKLNVLQKLGNQVTGIKLRKKLTMTDLTAIAKATRNFLGSATSSPYKVSKVVKDTKKAMLRTLKLKDDNLSMDDIETYYNMLNNNDFDYFNDKIGASSTWAAIGEAIDKNDNEDQFLKRLNTLIDLNDVDAKKKAISLFKKYVA